jgi:hypothetical protein
MAPNLQEANVSQLFWALVGDRNTPTRMGGAGTPPPAIP